MSGVSRGVAAVWGRDRRIRACRGGGPAAAQARLRKGRAASPGAMAEE